MIDPLGIGFGGGDLLGGEASALAREHLVGGYLF